jgi:hypothetical protein
MVLWHFLGAARSLGSAESLQSRQLRYCSHHRLHLSCEALEIRTAPGPLETTLQNARLPGRRSSRSPRDVHGRAPVAAIRCTAAGLLSRRLHRRTPLHRPVACYTKPTIPEHHRRNVLRVAALDDLSLHLAQRWSALPPARRRQRHCPFPRRQRHRQNTSPSSLNGADVSLLSTKEVADNAVFRQLMRILPSYTGFA